MKLHLNTDASQLLFTGYGDDHVLINGHRHDASLLLTARGVEIAPWAGLDFDALTAAHFEWVALRELDILLLGTGSPAALSPPLAHPRAGGSAHRAGSDGYRGVVPHLQHSRGGGAERGGGGADRACSWELSPSLRGA